MFLKTNRRIAAPISVTCLALLAFCLVERAVRKAIAPAVETCRAVCRPPCQADRPAGVRGTGQTAAQPRPRPRPTNHPPPPLQAKLLELLNLDPPPALGELTDRRPS